MIDKMPCAYGIRRTTAVRIRHQVSRRAALLSQLLSHSPTDLCRGLRCLKIWLSYKWNLVASWMHLHNCGSFQEHQRILLKSLRAPSLAPGGPGNIWKYFEALVRSTGVSGRFACGFLTDLHYADHKSDLWDMECVYVKLYTRTHWKDWPHKTHLWKSTMQFIAV